VRLAAIALAALLLVSGCGGGDGGEAEGREPGEWVADVCSAVGSWVEGIQEESTALGETAQGAENLEQARDQFVDFFDQVIERTEQMLAQIDGAGAPAVDDGEAIAEDLRSTLEPIQGAFEDARDDAENLPTDDPAAFQEGATQIGETVQQEAQEIGQAFDGLEREYDVPELDEAFEEEEACSDVAP
jgi:hypothetical protein